MAKDLRSGRSARIPLTESKAKSFILENKAHSQAIIKKYLWSPLLVDELFDRYFEDMIENKDTE